MKSIKERTFGIMIALLVVLTLTTLALLPRAFDRRWQFWGKENPESTITSAPCAEGNTPTQTAPVATATEVPLSPTTAPPAEEEVEEPPSAPVNSNPKIELILKYSDKEYSYISQEWEMSFGSVYGIELTGNGFERINEYASTAYFSVPSGYSAIIFTDGLGSNLGKAVFSNSEIVYFDKGNPTKVGESIFVPAGTKITIPFAANDSSGVLAVFSKDTQLLQEYIDFVK